MFNLVSEPYINARIICILDMITCNLQRIANIQTKLTCEISGQKIDNYARNIIAQNLLCMEFLNFDDSKNLQNFIHSKFYI